MCELKVGLSVLMGAAHAGVAWKLAEGLKAVVHLGGWPVEEVAAPAREESVTTEDGAVEDVAGVAIDVAKRVAANGDWTTACNELRTLIAAA